MKIGIITSSADMLYLFQVLNWYDFSYTILYDQEWWYRHEKDADFVVKRCKKSLDYLIKQGIEHIILPPTLELLLSEDDYYRQYIVPLFSTYVLHYVLPYSLVGKIGIVWEKFDVKHQYLIEKLCSKYHLHDRQSSIKTFHQPFAYRQKDTRMRKYFLENLWWKDRMMHNVIKHDLRYFCDAAVDTLIPLSYGYCAYDVTIKKYFHAKKCRWHGREAVQNAFAEITEHLSKVGSYSIRILYTGNIDYLLEHKKRIWMLQKWNNHFLVQEKITLDGM